MIKCKYCLRLLFIAACFFSSSCTTPVKKPLKDEVKNFANEISAALDSIRKDVEAARDFIEHVYNNRDTYDLTTRGMDIGKGVSFKNRAI